VAFTVLDVGEALVVDLVAVPAAAGNPLAPGTVRGVYLCLDNAAQPEPGVVVTRTFAEAAGNNLAHSTALASATANAQGVAELLGFIPGAAYYLQRGTGPKRLIRIPANAVPGTTVNLLDIQGEEGA
jgi:hypothetical protein